MRSAERAQRTLMAYAAPTECGSWVASVEEMVWKFRSLQAEGGRNGQKCAELGAVLFGARLERACCGLSREAAHEHRMLSTQQGRRTCCRSGWASAAPCPAQSGCQSTAEAHGRDEEGEAQCWAMVQGGQHPGRCKLRPADDRWGAAGSSKQRSVSRQAVHVVLAVPRLVRHVLHREAAVHDHPLQDGGRAGQGRRGRHA